MFFNFKKKIRDFVDQRLREMKKHQIQTQQTALDYAQIARLFPESNFIPFTSWTISPSVILHILNDIVINKRRNIIEFGSGASTLYIARLIQTLKLDAKFYSVESNKDWLKKMSEELVLYNLQNIVTLIHAPLSDASKDVCLKNQKVWYDTERITAALKGNHELDLVIVDGPYGGSTPYARYSAIPFLQKRLSKNLAIFLDDAQRDEEKEISIQWTKMLNLKPQYLKRYVYFVSDSCFITSPYKLSKL